MNKPFWFLLFLLFFIVKTNGQEVWTKVDSSVSGISSFPQQLGEAYYTLNNSLLKPTQKGINSNIQTLVLPNEKGEMETFSIVSVPLLSDALSKRYPNIKTYEGRSVIRPEVRVRLSTHPNGINAWLKLVEGPDFFIQTQKGQKNLHFTYLKSKSDFAPSLSCKTEGVLLKDKVQNFSAKTTSENNVVKIFRIAVATTGEYTSFWGDNDDSNGTNVEDAMGALVSSVNRISSVFEDEVKVRLELVSDERLIYEDQDTDPFSGNFATELQSTLDEVMGDSSYDIGHVFDYGQPDGDAGCIGCVCVSGKKGQGYSTHPFRDIFGGEYRNDYFDLDYAGHEIGHQFGAYHSFSFDTEGTGFNAEPGSGSTIMAYAGITAEDDVQLHGDPYFHFYSIQNILGVIATAECATTESLGTTVFSTNAGSDYYIPIGTAYELDAQQIEQELGTTYCWEQLDSGQVTSDSFGPYNVSGSLNRSLPPTFDYTRSIPNPEQLISNNLTQVKPTVNDAWETVPLVSRSMEWGLTVRRPFGNAIQVAQDKIKVIADASAGPFEITSQKLANIVLKGGSRETITWNVANTDTAPISVSSVTIYLSTDGGLTFLRTLASDIPNTGTAEVLIPNDINTDEARIKIKAQGGIFFALNSTVFSIESRNVVIQFEPYLKENCSSDSIQFDFTIERKEGFDETFSPQIEGLPAGVQAQFSRAAYSSSISTGFLILRGLNNLLPSDYSLFINIPIIADSEGFLFVLKQRVENNNAIGLINPANNATAQDINLDFEWESDPNSDSSRFQISLSENFNSFVKDTVLTKNQFSIKNLESDRVYYWRVQNKNSCNDAPFSDVFEFTTSKISCIDATSVSLPKSLLDATDNQVGITTASLSVSYDLPIIDINVLVDIEHTWVGDLTLYLESPDGTLYLLSSELGDSNDNYTQTLFDQEASTSIFEAQAPFTGSFKPLQDISVLYGTSSKGVWKLIVEDKYTEDSGQLLGFELELCVQGILLSNSDSDSIVDDNDNCPLLTNENQEDIDENGIGDVCDVFSALNISLTKKNTSCLEKDNGSLTFDARAEYTYTASIIGSNGFQQELLFTSLGKTLGNLAAGAYSICVQTSSFPEFEYCFDTEITAPPSLEVQAILNPSSSILDIDLSGGEKYNVMINGQTTTYLKEEKVQVVLTQKTNYVRVTTNSPCQGVYEEWINLGENAKIFPNPVLDEATLILPKGRKAFIAIYSGAGDMIWSKNHTIHQDLEVIPMNQFQPGWYLLRIDYDSYSETLKVLKQ